MEYEAVIYERDGAVARITLHRPEKRNAQNSQMISELDDAMRRAARDDEVNVIVLGGAGSSFSSGHDHKEVMRDPVVSGLRSEMTTRVALEREMYLEKCLAIRDIPKPTIAMVQGPCIAAGVMLIFLIFVMLAAERRAEMGMARAVGTKRRHLIQQFLFEGYVYDLGAAPDDAVFRDPTLDMGGGGAAAVEVLYHPWDFGARRAKRFLFFGEELTAAEALELGFVSWVFPRDELEARTMELAHTLASRPPGPIRMVKRSINQTLDRMGQRDSFEYHFVMHQLSHDGERHGDDASVPPDLERFLR